MDGATPWSMVKEQRSNAPHQAIRDHGPMAAKRTTAALLLIAGARAVVLSRGGAILLPGIAEAVAATAVPAGSAAWLVPAEWRSPNGRPRLRKLCRLLDGEGDWTDAAAAFIAAWASRTRVALLLEP